MPKSRRPRKPYKRPDYEQQARELNPEKYGAVHDLDRMMNDPEPLHLNPNPPKTHIDKPAPAPAHPHVAGPARAARGRSRYLVPVAAGAGVLGGAAYLAHRSRRRNTVHKGLINPITGESVVFEKRYLEDDLDESPRGVLVAKRTDDTALLHRGSRRGGRTPVSSTRVSGLPVQSASFSQGHPWERGGTSHANKLTHVRHRSKAPRTGKLFHLGSNKGKSSTMGKSAGFAQSGSSGRRIVSAY